MSFQPVIRVAIMHGLHGSGKSYAAAKIKEAFGLNLCEVFSTDDYFTRNGVYKFMPNKVGAYHAANVVRFTLALQSFAFHYSLLQGDAGIVVDNCNMQPPNVEPYFYAFKQVSTANRNCLMTFNLVTPDAEWRLDPEECAKRSGHNVSVDTIRQQSTQFSDWNDATYAKYNTGKATVPTPVSGFISSVRKTLHLPSQPS